MSARRSPIRTKFDCQRVVWPKLSNFRCAVSPCAHHEHECRPIEKNASLPYWAFWKLSKQRRCQKSRELGFCSSLCNEWFFELELIFPFSAEVHTLFSGIGIWGIYFLATFTQIVTQKEIKREKYRYEESTSPPMKRQLGVQAQSHLVCALVFFASRPKYDRFQPDGFLFLIFLQKPHLTWE